MMFWMNRFDPKTVVIIHFTTGPIKIILIKIFLYNVIKYMESCTKVALNFFSKKGI